MNGCFNSVQRELLRITYFKDKHEGVKKVTLSGQVGLLTLEFSGERKKRGVGLSGVLSWNALLIEGDTCGDVFSVIDRNRTLVELAVTPRNAGRFYCFETVTVDKAEFLAHSNGTAELRIAFHADEMHYEALPAVAMLAPESKATPEAPTAPAPAPAPSVPPADPYVLMGEKSVEESATSCEEPSPDDDDDDDGTPAPASPLPVRKVETDDDAAPTPPPAEPVAPAESEVKEEGKA